MYGYKIEITQNFEVQEVPNPNAGGGTKVIVIFQNVSHIKVIIYTFYLLHINFLNIF